MKAIECDACGRFTEPDAAVTISGDIIWTFSLSETVPEFKGGVIDLCVVCAHDISAKIKEVLCRTKVWK
jgi:hypothetical protein